MKNYIEEWNSIYKSRNENEMNDEEFLKWKDSKLNFIVNYVKQKSNFYSKHFQNFDTTNISLKNLNKLPFTTKDDLRSSMYDILSGDVRDADFFYSTTGTTGKATPCPRSNIDIEINNLPIKKHLKLLTEHHCKNSRPVVAVFAPNELHSVCFTLGLVTKELGMCKFDIFPLSPVVGFQRCFELLLDLKVNVLICSPGLIMSLAEMAEAYGVDISEDLGVELILCTGEFCSPFMISTIEETWGVPTYNFMYGSQEAMCIALAEPNNEKGLLDTIETNFVYELLDINSNPVSDDSLEGELCLTMLIPGIKPLIRYKTGDWVKIDSNQLGTNLKIQILGRIKDMIMLNNKMSTPEEIESLIYADNIKTIYGYQIVLQQQENAKEHITLKITPKEDADINSIRSNVIEKFSHVFDVDIQVEFLPILNLETATGGWVSWKAARIIDNRINVDDIENSSAEELALSAHRSL